MTRIDFYVLKDARPNARLGFVCRLVEKIYKQGLEILIHADDERQSALLDDLLWTWRQGSFIPHERLQASKPPATPVMISHDPALEAPSHQVLINLASEVPMFFSQFERVAEVVDPDEQTRQSARQRYRFYQDRGYPLDSHDIS